jgi:hypothetical protein
VIAEANRIIYGDREKTYGHPSKNFDTTAALWNAFLSTKYRTKFELDCNDVAILMTLLKIAREAHEHKRDNIVDGIGYLACIGKIEDYEEAQDEALRMGIDFATALQRVTGERVGPANPEAKGCGDLSCEECGQADKSYGGTTD